MLFALELPLSKLPFDTNEAITYCFVMFLSTDQRIQIGQRGEIFFQSGFYAYVGSAKKNPSSRINRHWLGIGKKKWHIDYLRAEAKPHSMWVFRQTMLEECHLAEYFRKFGFDSISNFGSSDCRCPSHLFYSSNGSNFESLLRECSPVFLKFLVENERSLSMKQYPEKIRLLFERRSIRRFSGERINNEHLLWISEAGLAAPSASNRRPWHITIITNRDELNRLAEVNPYGKMLTKAAAAFVVSGDKNRMYEGEGRDFWIQDCSAVTQNILLATHGLGYGGVWIGQHPLQDRKNAAREILMIPDHLEPLSLIAVGVPEENKEARTQWEETQVTWRE